MRLPDPYTHPGLAPGFEKVTLIDHDPVIRDRLANNRVNEIKTGGQYWGIELPYPVLLPNEADFLYSFLFQQKRQGGFIEVLLPQYERNHVSGDIAASKVLPNQKGSTVKITIPNLTRLPRPGDLFKLSTHYKVYMITDVSKNNDTLTLGIHPDLHITTTGSEKPVFNGILFQTKPTNLQALKMILTSDGVYEGFTLSLEESTNR